MISSLVHHVRPDDGLTEKGLKHVVYLLTPYTLIKFCVLTDPPYINCDIVIAHNGDDPPKDYAAATLWPS